MGAAAKQVEIGGLDSEAEEALAIEAGYVWREQLWSAMRSFVESYVDAENGLKKYDGCAYRLNKRWEEKGRPVTAGGLKQALADAERNNFRLEWAYWFASQCPDIARLLGCKMKAAKTLEELFEDFITELGEDLPHKRIQGALRRARAR